MKVVNGLIDLSGFTWGDSRIRHLIANGFFGTSSEYQRHLIANGLAPANPGLPDSPRFAHLKGYFKPEEKFPCRTKRKW